MCKKSLILGYYLHSVTPFFFFLFSWFGLEGRGGDGFDFLPLRASVSTLLSVTQLLFRLLERLWIP